MDGHRKRIKHFHEPGHLHELTFSCYQRLPLLTDDCWRGLLCQSIDRSIASHAFGLVAFVLMPEHVHLLVYPRERPGDKTLAAEARGSTELAEVRQWHPEPGVKEEISRLLADIKRPFSGRVKKRLVEQNSPLLARLTVQERPGKTAFRFWQEGPGYDRNFETEKAVLAAIEYIHQNPVRRGLVRTGIDWKWSSARWYASDRNEIDPDLPTIHGLPPEFFD